MIEKIIYDYLKSKLTIPVCMEMPEKPSIPMILIEKTAGGMDDHVYEATIAIQSYGKTLYKSAEINEMVKNTMLDAIELDKVSEVKINSDYNFTDTERKLYRYQAVFDIKYLK